MGINNNNIPLHVTLSRVTRITDGLLMAIHSEDNEQERTKWSALSIRENDHLSVEMSGLEERGNEGHLDSTYVQVKYSPNSLAYRAVDYISSSWAYITDFSGSLHLVL